MNKRILFVDDDQLQLEVYSMMLKEGPEQWEVATAGNAREALQLMAQFPFDVIVSDWMLPGMDGAELMNQVRQDYPRSSRVILSVIGDQEKVARSLGDTHQFIAKPFDVKLLKATLTRICGLDAYLKEEQLRALVGQIGSLPSFPPLYAEIMKELAAPDSSIDSIAAIMSRDPAMTAKMLQIVNSAVVGLAHRVSSPFEAIEYLGLGTVRSLVLSAHIFSCLATDLDPLFVQNLWNHAIRSGVLTQMILRLEQAHASDCEDGYVAGMLHDVGKLMLVQSLPMKFKRALKLAAERDIPFHEAEQEVLGGTHAGVAAYLLGLWGLPAAIVEAVAFHHTPHKSESRAFGPLSAVHAANVLEHELSKGQSWGKPAQFDLDYLSSVGLEHRLEAWRAQTKKILQKEA